MNADVQPHDREITAFSKWVYPHTPDPNAEDPETSIRNEPQPSGSNNELIIEYMTTFLHRRQKWLVPEMHYCSYYLEFHYSIILFFHTYLQAQIYILMITLSHENPRRSTKISTTGSRVHAPKPGVRVGG